MTRGPVVGLLLLTALIGVAPDLHPPAGTFVHMGLAAFQTSVIALATVLMLVMLLVSSQYNVFWRSFVLPENHRRSAWMTARYCGLLLAGGAVLLFGIFVVGVYSFWANTQEPRLVLDITGLAPNIVALLVAGEGIGMVRVLILSGLSRTTVRHA